MSILVINSSGPSLAYLSYFFGYPAWAAGSSAVTESVLGVLGMIGTDFPMRLLNRFICFYDDIFEA